MKWDSKDTGGTECGSDGFVQRVGLCWAGNGFLWRIVIKMLNCLRMSIFFSTFAAEMCAYTTCILEYDENRCDITYLIKSKIM